MSDKQIEEYVRYIKELRRNEGLDEARKEKHQLVDLGLAGYRYKDIENAVEAALDDLSIEQGLPRVDRLYLKKAIGYLKFTKIPE